MPSSESHFQRQLSVEHWAVYVKGLGKTMHRAGYHQYDY